MFIHINMFSDSDSEVAVQCTVIYSMLVRKLYCEINYTSLLKSVLEDRMLCSPPIQPGLLEDRLRDTPQLQ